MKILLYLRCPCARCNGRLLHVRSTCARYKETLLHVRVTCAHVTKNITTCKDARVYVVKAHCCMGELK